MIPGLVGALVAGVLLAGCSRGEERRVPVPQTRRHPATRHRPSRRRRLRRPSPSPSPTPSRTEPPQLAGDGRPRLSSLGIPAIGVTDLRVVPYRGSPDDAPGHQHPERRRRRQPVRPRRRSRAGRRGQLHRHRPPHVVDPGVRPAAGAASRRPGARGGRSAQDEGPLHLRDRPHPQYVVPLPGLPRAAVGRRPGTPRPDTHPRDGHAVDLRHARGPRAGNFWADEFDNPEHRIDKIGVLVARRTL